MTDQAKDPAAADRSDQPEETKKEDQQKGGPPSADELATAKAQAEEYLAGWKRAVADYANLQKSVDKAREDMVKFACVGLVTELLPVIDSFKKALAAAPKSDEGSALDESAKQWIGGVGRIGQQLDTVLKKAGLEPIEEAGVVFDPALHEAMMTRKQEGVGSGRVLEVLEPGYRLHDKVVRAAKVAVSE